MTLPRKVALLAVLAVAGLCLVTLPRVPWLVGLGVFAVACAGIGLFVVGIGESRRGR